MKKFQVCAIVLAMLATPVLCFAAGKAKAKICASFSEATLSTGGKLGVCAPSKAGGKPAYLRTYQIVTVTDDEGKEARVMVGFR